MSKPPRPFIEPGDLDRRLSYRRGRSARLARKGLIPHVLLPDGEIRFDPEVIDKWLAELSVEADGIAVPSRGPRLSRGRNKEVVT